ncbi:MAG: DUF1002 domain-containing protein [Peptostreptococcaceae bacterium]
MNKTFNNFKKKIITLTLISTICLSNVFYVFADSARVVTLGADLTDAQKETMLNYFGVKETEVVVLEVNNQEEREYLEGLASNSQIGTKTYSCAFVEPTKSGSGINVKTANITWVSASMVATTLSTAGMTDANVVIAANFPVSGTGALTGIMKAFEDATGEALDSEKKEIATEELVITGQLGESIETEFDDDKVAQDKATAIINDIKLDVIKNNTSDTIQIAETINNITNNYGITLSDSQFEQITSLMQRVADQNYDYSEMENALGKIQDSVSERLDEIGEGVKKGFFDGFSTAFAGIGEFFGNIFSSNDEVITDNGILNQTNDDALGENVQVDATDKTLIELPTKEEAVGFFQKIINFFKNLFGMNTSNDSIQNSEEITPEVTPNENLQEVPTDEIPPATEEHFDNTDENLNEENSSNLDTSEETEDLSTDENLNDEPLNNDEDLSGDNQEELIQNEEFEVPDAEGELDAEIPNVTEDLEEAVLENNGTLENGVPEEDSVIDENIIN